MNPDRELAEERLSLAELQDAWALLPPDERAWAFRTLPPQDAEDFFLSLSSADQEAVLLALVPEDRRSWMRLLPPDDAADLVQAAPSDERENLLALLDDATRREVGALLAYAEDDAGGLMNPRFARVRPDMTVDEAITYLRKQAREHLISFHYAYVLDDHQKLLGVVPFRELFSSSPDKRIREVMRVNVVTVSEDMDQEAVSRLFTTHHFLAIPVVDVEGRMKGIVTADDIVEVVREEATEDIQKLGGMQALDEPYMATAFLDMIRKRGVWLAVLFVGEMLTATAMSYFEDEIQRAVVLALFIPLIISSGGNSGSQATMLVIRAMSLGEVRLRDWWRVARREVMAGLALGLILGAIGFVRIVAWQQFQPIYGQHYLAVAFTVAFSLIGVVMFGTTAGSLLPFLLRALRLDPASASAPFVATLVDVSGIVIYFTIASIILAGKLL
jgi:magnesium transporter